MIEYLEYLQETDSNIVIPVEEYLNHFIPVDSTIGSYGEVDYLSQAVHDVFNDAWNVINSIADTSQKQFTTIVINRIQTQIEILNRFNLDTSKINKLYASVVDDGSILFEWIYDSFRIGFSIEDEVDTSSWYIVSNDELGSIGAAGYLKPNQYEKFIPWIVNFIHSYS